VPPVAAMPGPRPACAGSRITYPVAVTREGRSNRAQAFAVTTGRLSPTARTRGGMGGWA
jgi:hypothetical protein